ncbi:TPA: DUF2591 domain-containing protein [Pseudomonas aeruginosa]|uniref:hypothetical protein n=1 Tax=Ectopseudomonas hydrolytica TaxID=2493633 RepID=UPI003C305B4A|nr:DUF2591 domain-containing protein [Pseudomonas aeruginosa]HBP6378468.1 DUF2591 domain-containing protein [Pseudomonas aeruginosa]
MNSTPSPRKKGATVLVAVNSLTTIQIDWLIAQQEGVAVIFDGAYIRYALADENALGAVYSPSTDPALGHPLLEREKVQLRHIDREGHSFNGLWLAQDCRFWSSGSNVGWSEYGRSYADLHFGYLSGPTMLIAGLRFIIAKTQLGKTENPKIEVPRALTEANAA